MEVNLLLQNESKCRPTVPSRHLLLMWERLQSAVEGSYSMNWSSRVWKVVPIRSRWYREYTNVILLQVIAGGVIHYPMQYKSVLFPFDPKQGWLWARSNANHSSYCHRCFYDRFKTCLRYRNYASINFGNFIRLKFVKMLKKASELEDEIFESTRWTRRPWGIHKQA